MPSFRDVFKTAPIDDKSHVMKFGKYAGNTLETIIDEWRDAQYLVWLHHNTDFELSADLLEECEGWGEQQARQWAREKESF